MTVRFSVGKFKSLNSFRSSVEVSSSVVRTEFSKKVFNIKIKNMMDLSEIPGEPVRQAIRETIENQLKSKNFRLKVSSASKEGENNFLGVVFRVSFNAVDVSENSANPSLIVKVAPQNETRRTHFHSRKMFLQEIFMYNEVLPYLQQFERSKGVVIEDNGFFEYPICYQTLDEEPYECLLLEDLSVRGFSIVDRFTEEVTADHVHLFMKALAKFHAISFALKDQQPEKFLALASNLREVFRADDLLVRDYFNKQVENVLDILKNDEDAKLLARMKELFERDAIDIAAECLDPKSAENAAVISYGDAWQNNSMYRYDDQGKPNGIVLLDWQISRHSTPIIDIAYFIFCCTTKEVRDAHYDNFLDTYHSSLSTHIRRLGSRPEKLFPYETMQEHFRKFGKIGLVFATAVLPVITAEKGNAIDLDEAANNMANNKGADAFDGFVSEKSREKFTKRMRDVVVDMVRLGYV